MTPVLQPLPRGESLTVEFKTSFNEDVSQTLVAFANAKGGSVFVGVSDSGELANTERWDYPLEAIREIFPDRIEFFNPGALPPGLELEQLLSDDYISRPRNRVVAQLFKDTGWIEKYGSGIKRVRRGYEQHGMAMPEYRCDGDSVMVISRLTGKNTQVTPQVTPQVGELLKALGTEERSREELMAALGLADREHFRKAYLEAALNAGLIERTIPDKPNSRLQKYRKSGGRA